MSKITLLKNIDRLVGTLASRVLPFPVERPVPAPSSFLLIRPGGIGDAVLLVSVLNSLKQKFPHASIDVLAEKRNGSIFKLCPAVNHVFLYDNGLDLLHSICRRYDVVIDTEQWHRLSAVVSRLTRSAIKIGFASNERKRLFTHAFPYSHSTYEVKSFFSLLAPLGITFCDYSVPFLDIPEGEKENAKLLLDNVARPDVVLFPGASIAERRWGAEKFGVLAQRLRALQLSVILIGGKEDVEEGEKIAAQADVLNLVGKLSLVGSAAIIEKSAVLISGDSGILHIGVGLDTPTVSLFGPGIAKKWAPREKHHVVLNKNLSCSPCTKFGYTPKCTANGRCIQQISVDEVLKGVLQLLEK